MNQYQPGAVVNGHQLNETGTEWVPLNDGVVPGAPTPPPTGKKPMSRGKKIGIGVGGTFLGLVLLGSVLPDPEAAPASAAPESAPTASASPTEEPEVTSTPTTPEASETTAAEVPPAETAAPVQENDELSSEYGTYPTDQAKFVRTVADSREEIDNASNDLKRSAALRERDRELAKIVGSDLAVKNWVGKVTDVGANGEGKAYVEIEIAENVRVKTWNNAFSDIGDSTLIPESSPMFDSLLNLEEGDTVVFSGKFFGGSDTALYGTNMTETFYGIDPQFLFKFSSIKAA